MKVSVNMSRVAADLIRAMPRKETARRVLQGIGPAAFAAWVTFAKAQLRSTSRAYVQGLQMEPGDYVWKIHLTGKIPNMVENGWDGGDMKSWMLNSKKAKQGIHGPYLDIPFRHGTPGTGGRNVGTAMPAAIHAMAKKLTPTVTGGNARFEGGMKRLVAGGPGLSKKASKILDTITKPTHTTSIYSGMIRNATMTPKGPQTSGFMTFRRISDKSKGWQHGGINPGKHIAPQVQKYVNLIAKAKIAEALK